MTQPDQWRRLTGGELAQADRVYVGSINYDRVRIYNAKYAVWQPDRIAMAPNGNIYFPPPIFKEDYSRSVSDMAFLIHELAHVWQIQHGVWLKIRRVLIEGGLYDYGRLDPNRTLNSYTVEQQASIIADWYLIVNGGAQQHGTGAAQDYATIVRRAIPAPSR